MKLLGREERGGEGALHCEARHSLFSRRRNRGWENGAVENYWGDGMTAQAFPLVRGVKRGQMIIYIYLEVPGRSGGRCSVFFFS